MIWVSLCIVLSLHWVQHVSGRVVQLVVPCPEDLPIGSWLASDRAVLVMIGQVIL